MPYLSIDAATAAAASAKNAGRSAAGRQFTAWSVLKIWASAEFRGGRWRLIADVSLEKRRASHCYAIEIMAHRIDQCSGIRIEGTYVSASSASPYAVGSGSPPYGVSAP